MGCMRRITHTYTDLVCCARALSGVQRVMTTDAGLEDLCLCTALLGPVEGLQSMLQCHIHPLNAAC